MLPLSLRKLCKAFDVPTPKSFFPVKLSDIDTQLDKGIPAYDFYDEYSLTREQWKIMNDETVNWNFMEEAIKYCRIDCIALFDVLVAFNKLVFTDYNINIFDVLTLPSLAMRIFKTHTPKATQILYYTDTDSIVTNIELSDNYVGPNLGQFKLEHEISQAVFLAPKVYAFIDSKTSQETIKVKGINHKALANELITYKALFSLLRFGATRDIPPPALPCSSAGGAKGWGEKWYSDLIGGRIHIALTPNVLEATTNKRKPHYRRFRQLPSDWRPFGSPGRDLFYTDTLPYHYSEVEVDYNKSVEASIQRNKRSHSSVEAQLNAVKKAIDSVQGLSDGSQAYIYHFADDFMDE